MAGTAWGRQRLTRSWGGTTAQRGIEGGEAGQHSDPRAWALGFCRADRGPADRAAHAAGPRLGLLWRFKVSGFYFGREACGTLVPQAGSAAAPLRWKH